MWAEMLVPAGVGDGLIKEGPPITGARTSNDRISNEQWPHQQ
jgi:hypothetical protein